MTKKVTLSAWGGSTEAAMLGECHQASVTKLGDTIRIASLLHFLAGAGGDSRLQHMLQRLISALSSTGGNGSVSALRMRAGPALSCWGIPALAYPSAAFLLPALGGL